MQGADHLAYPPVVAAGDNSTFIHHIKAVVILSALIRSYTSQTYPPEVIELTKLVNILFNVSLNLYSFDKAQDKTELGLSTLFIHRHTHSR